MARERWGRQHHTRRRARAVRSAAIAVGVLVLLAQGAPAAALDAVDCDPHVFDPAALPMLCGLVPIAPVELGPDAIAVDGPEGERLGPLALGAGPAGTLEFAGRLPDLEGHDAVRSLADEAMWPCPPSVDDPDARFLPVRLTARDGRSELVLANAAPDASLTPGSLMVVFVHADAPVRVQATCPIEPEALHVDIVLAAGWNAVASVVVEQEGSFAILLRPLAEDDLPLLEWNWRHQTAMPHDGAPPPAVPFPPQRERP